MCDGQPLSNIYKHLYTMEDVKYVHQTYLNHHTFFITMVFNIYKLGVLSSTFSINSLSEKRDRSPGRATPQRWVTWPRQSESTAAWVFQNNGIYQ